MDFDRQIVVNNYIIDFYIKSLGLAIEIDGWYHEFKKEKDKNRQNYLESLELNFFFFLEFQILM